MFSAMIRVMFCRAVRVAQAICGVSRVLGSMIGERLKHAFTGNTAWILSYREECFDQIGLKPTTKIPLFNGALECEFRQYEIFDGKYKEFREGGDELSKEPKELKLASGERREVKTCQAAY